MRKGQKVRRTGIPCDASSQTHEKMSVSCIEEIYAKYIEKAKREYPEMFRYNYTPHSMRHTTAIHMLEARVPKESRKESASFRIIKQIQAIYREEEKLKELSSKERLVHRQVVVKPLVDALFAYLKQHESGVGTEKLPENIRKTKD